MYRPKIYTASKISHGAMWKDFELDYLNEIEFTARWLQFTGGPDHNTTFWTEEQKTQHWIHDIQDVQRSDYLLIYEAPGDMLSGSICEAGAALGLGKIVLAVGLADRHSWQSHPLVLRFESVKAALLFVTGKDSPQ